MRQILPSVFTIFCIAVASNVAQSAMASINSYQERQAETICQLSPASCGLRRWPCRLIKQPTDRPWSAPLLLRPSSLPTATRSRSLRWRTARSSTPSGMPPLWRSATPWFRGGAAAWAALTTSWQRCGRSVPAPPIGSIPIGLRSDPRGQVDACPPMDYNTLSSPPDPDDLRFRSSTHRLDFLRSSRLRVGNRYEPRLRHR